MIIYRIADKARLSLTCKHAFIHSPSDAISHASKFSSSLALIRSIRCIYGVDIESGFEISAIKGEHKRMLYEHHITDHTFIIRQIHDATYTFKMYQLDSRRENGVTHKFAIHNLEWIRKNYSDVGPEIIEMFGIDI